jgi:hypothetical protein
LLALKQDIVLKAFSFPPPKEKKTKGILYHIYRVPCKRVKFRDEVSTRGYDTFPFRKDADYLCALHQNHLAAVTETTCEPAPATSEITAVTCKATQDVESRL